MFPIPLGKTFGICIILILLTFTTYSVSAFKPSTHIAIINEIIDEVNQTPIDVTRSDQFVNEGKTTTSDGTPDPTQAMPFEVSYVTIDGKKYPVDPRIAEAISKYPDYFRGGAVGPDFYPDYNTGQPIIHADIKCHNGDLKGSNCHEKGSFTYMWLQHIYNSGWDYYNKNNVITCDSSNLCSNKGQQALAFTYGYLTHAAADMWSHTLVNEYTGGTWPFFEDLINDPDRVMNPIKHVIIEAYIGSHTKETNLEIKSPKDFIYDTFIDQPGFRNSQTPSAVELSDGKALYDMFFGLRGHLKSESDDLKNKIKNCDGKINVECIKTPTWKTHKAYVDNWIQNIDTGLEKWPQMGQDIAYAIVTEEDFDKAELIAKDFFTDRYLRMRGDPGVMASVADAVEDVDTFVNRLLHDFQELEMEYDEFKNKMILEATGLDLDKIKEIMKKPETYINGGHITIMEKTYDIGLPKDTSKKLDSLMGITDGYQNPEVKFDIDKFSAAYNAKVLSKLILLSPETLNQLLSDRGVKPLYAAADDNDQGNVMLGFIRLLDGHEQWRLHTTQPGHDFDYKFGEGMKLWIDCTARNNVFRTTFHDWPHNYVPPNVPKADYEMNNVNLYNFHQAFPDWGEVCKHLPVPTVNPPVGTVDEVSSNLKEKLKNLPAEKFDDLTSKEVSQITPKVIKEIPPSTVANLSNKTIGKLPEDTKKIISPKIGTIKASGTKSGTTISQQGIPSGKGIQLSSDIYEKVFIPPLQQLAKGISPDDIICNQGLDLIKNNLGKPACVKPSTAEMLISLGWTRISG